jgi:hypothetical protein
MLIGATTVDPMMLVLKAASAHFLICNGLIREGGTEKLSQFIMLLKSIIDKNISFTQQKMYFLNITESMEQ